MTRFGTNWRAIFLGAVIGALAFGAADATARQVSGNDKRRRRVA